MPCRCDEYDISSARHDNNAETLHRELCRARAIIAKLIAEEGKPTFNADIKRKAQQDIDALAAHKRKEIQKDIDQLMKRRKSLYEAKRQFEAHGGDGSSMQPKLDEVDSEISRLKGLTDYQLVYET
jgi:hypothetical protein